MHSHYSFDSANNPKNILKKALKNQLKAISITDHGSMRGSLKLSKLARKEGDKINIVKGVEFISNFGDIIGLFIQEMIRSHDVFEIIDQIKEQGGLVVLPHPYVAHKSQLIEKIAKKSDIIEIWNSRSTLQANIKAYQLALELKKPFIASSDAHLLRDIGRSYTRIKPFSDQDELFELLKQNEHKSYHFGYTSKFSKDSSLLIKIIKENPKLIPRKLIGLSLYYLIAILKREERVVL